MLKKWLSKCRKIKAPYVLSFLFLVYIFFTGYGAFPQLLDNISQSLQWNYGPAMVIQILNDQYSGMLETDPRKTALQDKGTYINFNGLMAKLMKQPLMNKQVTLKNGHLASPKAEAADPSRIQSSADNLIRFHQKQVEAQGHFLFVIAPSQISKYEDLLPTGYTDSTNASADALLALLAEAGVHTLDLRECMQQEGIRTTEAFFATDHHWLPQTGFWAYTKILSKLTQMGAIRPVDQLYTDMENYMFETYPDTFLGSAGKRTGIYYAGIDDSIFLRPGFETKLELTVPARNLALQGPYEDISYNTDVVHNFTDPDFFNENMYGLYGWGDNPIAHWRNPNAPEQKRVLMIGESFGNIPFSLFPLVLSECDEIDPRHYDGDFQKYYAEFAPETVVFLITVGSVPSEITEYPYIPE